MYDNNYFSKIITTVLYELYVLRWVAGKIPLSLNYYSSRGECIRIIGREFSFTNLFSSPYIITCINYIRTCAVDTIKIIFPRDFP